ncbi:MAG: GNAT family N-acetyltransferase [Chloroflexi bacterium]|nr:GNAT family N-acetyltransferase [Chloroflexota bacterium]
MAVLAPITLAGRHVKLAPLALEHVPALVAAASVDRASYRWTFVPGGADAMTTYVQEALALRDAGLALPFATIDAATGTVIGTTRYGNVERWPWPEANPNRREVDAVEIGWTWLSAAAQRTPINTEAKYLMMRHAFETWGVHRLVLQTDERNERSRRAIERIGARLEGILRANRASSIGDVRSTAVYSVIAAEWPGVKAALEARMAARG